MNDSKRQGLRLVHITTVPITLDIFFRGQIGYLKARGVHVSAITSPGDRVSQIARREAIPIHTVPMKRTINPLADVIALWRLWRLLCALRPDIVHSHTPKAALLGTLAARAAGTRIVALSIFGLAQMSRKGFTRYLLNFTTRFSCAAADWVWCDSFSVREYVIRERLCPPEKIVVLGHGSVKGVDAVGIFSPANFNADERERIRAEYGIPRQALVLGFVGRIVADKGMHELAAAWREVRARHLELHLLLVGPFELQDPLLPEDENLFHTDPRVHLAGLCEDVARHLAAMDIFVMPSYREGFGVTNIEAAAMALPVISTRIPGCIDSVIDEVTATLVPPHDATALAQAIERYCDDAELRERHGQAGRERVLRDFRPEVIWEELFQEYQSLIQAKHIVGSPAVQAVTTSNDWRK